MYTSNNRTGFLMSVTGPDKSGKGTQWALLGYALTKLGYDVELITYPDYSTIGGFLIEVALRRHEISKQIGKKLELPRETIAQLYAFDRTYHIKQIKDALNKGKIVITKRSTTMTHAPYQVGFFGFNFFDIFGIDALHPKYDASVFLDVRDPVIKKRNEDFDKHDSEADYTPDENEQISQEPIAHMQDFLHQYNILPIPYKYRVNADGPYEEVFRSIFLKILPLLKSHNIPRKNTPGTLIKIGREEAPSLNQIDNYVKEFNFNEFLELVGYSPDENKSFGSKKFIVQVNDYEDLFEEGTDVYKLKNRITEIINNAL